MVRILGYGEDALTLWALEDRLSDILGVFQDKTSPSDCVIFYRPSFGRVGGEKSAEFGEFDAIFASLKNIYLIESKWDNLSGFRHDEVVIIKEQELRHHIFSLYLMHWHRKHYDNWESFRKEYADDFKKLFQRKEIAPNGSLLSENLSFILNALKSHCRKVSKNNVRNVLLFFYFMIKRKVCLQPKLKDISSW